MGVNIDLDGEKFIALPVFIIAVGTVFNVFTTPVIPLEYTLFELDSGNFDIAHLLAAGMLVFILVNRDKSITATKGVDVWISWATFGMVLSPPFFSTLQGTLAEPPLSLLAFVVSIIGIFLASAIN